MEPDKKKTGLNRFIEFLTEDIWRVEISAFSRLKKAFLGFLKVIYIVVKGFWSDNCALRSSALTYASLLSVVPLLAFSFAMARAFGLDISPLKNFLIEKVALGNEQIGTELFDYVDNIRASTLGPPALALLVFTVISVMSNIESSFNHIWGVGKARTLWRRFSDYLSVLVVSPLFVVAGVAIGGVLRSNQFVAQVLQFALIQKIAWTMINSLLICLGFTFLYIFMPNTRVKLRAALAGGLVAGLVWQAALWGYVTFQVGFVKYARIYGAVASIPINLVWVYISWIIVLLGAEISFAVQNVRTYQREKTAYTRSWAYRELVALNILIRIAADFLQGRPPQTAAALAGAFEIPIRLVNQTLEGMVDGGLLNEVKGEQQAYQPARDLSVLTVREVIRTIRDYGTRGKVPDKLRKSSAVTTIEKISDRGLDSADGKLTLEDILSDRSDAARERD